VVLAAINRGIPVFWNVAIHLSRRMTGIDAWPE